MHDPDVKLWTCRGLLAYIRLMLTDEQKANLSFMVDDLREEIEDAARNKREAQESMNYVLELLRSGRDSDENDEEEDD